MIIFLYPVTIPAWITVTVILLELALLSLWPIAWLHEQLQDLHLLTRAANALPDWRIWDDATLPGRAVSFCGNYWLPLLLAFFVLFSLIVHTLLPR